MIEQDETNFERQLRRIQPAKPPEEFLLRLRAQRQEAPQNVAPVSESLHVLLRSLRWWVPFATAVVVAAVIWRGGYFSSPTSTSIGPSPALGTATAPVGMRTDDVKIDQQLLSSFDAVARLPDGEPVRFRCENWMDQVVLSDKTQGLIVENRTPRFEIVAVRYDTY